MVFNKKVKTFQVDKINMIGNFQNGAIVGLNNDGKRYVEDIKKKRRGQITNDSIQELEDALLELNFYQDRKEKTIDAAYVHVTDNCNLHCLGCYSFVDKRNDQYDLSKEAFFKIFRSLKEAGVKQVVISGGEPFLRDDLYEIVRYAKEFCQIEYITVITNGTLEWDRYENTIPYLDEINISVDGYNSDISYIRDKGIMPKVINTIKRFKDLVNTNLIITLHKKNIDHMKDYMNFSNKLGVKYSFSIFTVNPNNEAFKDFMLTDLDLIQIERNLMELDNEVEVRDFPVTGMNLVCRERCEAGNKLISISADGTIYPCHMLHERELALGNATKSSIYEIVFSKENEFQKIHVDEMNHCNSCNYKYLCGGGCRGRSYLYYSSLYEKDAYCTLIKNYYEDVMESIATMIENGIE